ncbi:DoxX family membrane protein [Bacillus cereus]
MEECYLILRFLLGIIFFSTGYTKLTSLEEHTLLVEKYNLLPRNIIHIIVKISAVLELFISLSLISGILQNISFILILILLLSYNLAMIVNLFRGNTDFSCGCGGLLGDYKLSWWIVGRNFFIILLDLFLLSSNYHLGNIKNFFTGLPISTVFSLKVFIIFLISLIIIFIHQNIMNFLKINKIIRTLSK